MIYFYISFCIIIFFSRSFKNSDIIWLWYLATAFVTFLSYNFFAIFFYFLQVLKRRNILSSNLSIVWSDIILYWFNTIPCVSLNSYNIHSDFGIHHRCLSKTLMSLKLSVDLENHTRWSSVRDVLGSGVFVSVCLFFSFVFNTCLCTYVPFGWMIFWRGLVFINAA